MVMAPHTSRTDILTGNCVSASREETIVNDALRIAVPMRSRVTLKIRKSPSRVNVFDIPLRPASDVTSENKRLIGP